MVEGIGTAASKPEATVTLTNQLQELLDNGDYARAQKICGGKIAKNSKSPFFNTIKAYCLMKQGKHADCNDILAEIRP